MNEGIHIIGLGAQTSVGRTAISSATSMLAGYSRRWEHPSLLDSHGSNVMVSMAPYVPADLLLVDRWMELAVDAIREALTPLEQLLGQERPPVPLMLGLPALPESALPLRCDKLLRRLRRRFMSGDELSSIRTVTAGHSAGLIAISQARQFIEDGYAPFCLAGGVDSTIDPALIDHLEEQDQLKTERNPWGLIPGEGAGFCLLAAGPLPDGLRSLARLVSVAVESEPHPLGSDGISIGEGLTKAWRGALEPLAEGATIAQLVSDLNGEPYRANELGLALTRHNEQLAPSWVHRTPTKFWGDVGAASGPLGVCVALAEDITSDDPCGKLSLISTSSESGERCAAVVDSRSLVTDSRQP